MTPKAIFIIMAWFVGVIMGISFEYYAHKHHIATSEEHNTLSDTTSVSSTAKKDTITWDAIKDAPFEIDLQSLDVVLVKRSINNGDEVTLIEYKNRESDFFVCSMEIHRELVRKFQEILRKRETE